MPPSARHLIAANLATLVMGLLLGWHASALLWPYWIQSVVIGWYARKRILGLAAFSTANFSYNGRPVPEEEASKRLVARFFCFHYGFFHFVYFVFLVGNDAIASARDLLALGACGLSFAFSQRHTWAEQHAADLRGKPNLGILMATPYLRIVPMHMGVILAANIKGPAMLAAFIGLKTVSDLVLDRIDRSMAVRAADKVAAGNSAVP